MSYNVDYTTLFAKKQVIKVEKKKVSQKISTELKIQGKSEKTIKVYVHYNLWFLEFIKKNVDKIDQDDIKELLAYLISERANDPVSLALARSALAFFYDAILDKNIVKGIKTSKKQRKHPEILTKKEIDKIMEKSDLRTRLLIDFMYGSGLRVAECASLKWSDLDIDEKLGRLKKGKGGKDRLFILPNHLIKDLEKWKLDMGGEGHIFNIGGYPISTRTIQRDVKNAAEKAGIKKKVYPHLLRHSFATHLIESGVDIRVIQELLAHSNLQTTQFYTHISTKMIKSVKSPLDEK